MKKYFVLLFFVCSISVYSQTWVEMLVEGDPYFGTGEVTQEYTVLTKEQFDRLVQQYKNKYSNCRMEYTDVLELRNYPVISGTRPIFNGYYFFLVRTKNWMNFHNRSDTILVYGNSNTGRMELEFYNPSFGYGIQGDVNTNSDEYIKRWNQYLQWIKVK